MLRTSQPGETGLGPHTPSTCAGMCNQLLLLLLGPCNVFSGATAVGCLYFSDASNIASRLSKLTSGWLGRGCCFANGMQCVLCGLDGNPHLQSWRGQSENIRQRCPVENVGSHGLCEGVCQVHASVQPMALSGSRKPCWCSILQTSAASRTYD